MTRIAILLTNSDTSAFAQRFPNDGLKVVRLLQPLRPDWHFEVVAVKDGALPASPQAFDGFVITGSPASVNDDSLPWLADFLGFIRALDAARRPLIGLCFGHQAIARALGGKVARNAEGWGLGTAKIEWSISLGAAPWMNPAQDQSLLLAAHNEQVTQMPAQAMCLGGNRFCPTASMQIGQHIFTTQYHPEMTPEFMQALLIHLEQKVAPNWISEARHLLGLLSSSNNSVSQGNRIIESKAVIGSSTNASPEAPFSDTPLPDALMFGQWMVQFLEHAKQT